ncbi:unnamed protein product [Bodo saltans]|uniref:Reverse transcriptase n=1 Tax=Bodo saltans TaxID=75058 RepID=A0A0S4J395_BODSA|nr:unnamed protein product [Bodo saltans]|eukprot:CUG75999.1 unnamed protein product [Bodo saltans]
MLNDVPRLLASGILTPAPKESVRAWCRVFGLEEAQKGRRRLIVEPRDLNTAWQAVYPKCSLPNIADILRLVRSADELTQGDMKCYFYQIPLAIEVQPYYGVQIGKQTYTLTRLPMGATISVFVANAFATTIHREAVGTAPRLTYLDNLVSAGRNTQHLKNIATKVNATFGTFEEGTVMDVLGVNVDVARKKVKLAEKFLQKHKSLLEEVITANTVPDEWNNAKIWKILGVIFRYVEVARRPLADVFGLLQRIRKVARVLALEEVSWDDKTRGILQADLHQMQKLAVETLRRDEFAVDEDEETEPRSTDEVLFTDASTKGLGFVIISSREITVGSWKLPQSEATTPIHELEAEALSRALRVIGKRKRLIILTDNQILFHGLTRGRSNALRVNRAAGDVASNTKTTWVGWLPSEMNWADEPSRLQHFNVEKTGTVASHLAPVKQWHTMPRAPPE